MHVQTCLAWGVHQFVAFPVRVVGMDLPDVGIGVFTRGIAVIQGYGKVMLFISAHFHLLHHACAIICRVLQVALSKLNKLQSVKTAAVRGMVFAACSFEYLVNPVTGACKQNRMIKALVVGKRLDTS